MSPRDDIDDILNDDSGLETGDHSAFYLAAATCAGGLIVAGLATTFFFKTYYYDPVVAENQKLQRTVESARAINNHLLFSLDIVKQRLDIAKNRGKLNDAAWGQVVPADADDYFRQAFENCLQSRLNRRLHVTEVLNATGPGNVIVTVSDALRLSYGERLYNIYVRQKSTDSEEVDEGFLSLWLRPGTDKGEIVESTLPYPIHSQLQRAAITTCSYMNGDLVLERDMKVLLAPFGPLPVKPPEGWTPAPPAKWPEPPR